MNRTKKHFYAKIFLLFLSFLTSAIFWWSSSLIIENFPLSVPGLVASGFILFTALLFSLSFSALCSYLFVNTYLQLVLSGLLSLSSVLLINQLLFYIPAFLVSAVLIFYAIKKIHQRATSHSLVDASDIFKHYFQNLFLIFTTLLSLGLGLYSIQFTPQKVTLPRHLTNRVVEDLFVNLGMGDKILLLDEEGFKEEARSILESSEDLTEEEKNSLLNKDSDVMDNLVKSREIPGLTIDSFRLFIEQQINKFVQPFLKYIPLFLGLLLWLLLRLFTAPVVLLATALTEFLIKIFVNLGVLHLKKETVEAQRLTF